MRNYTVKVRIASQLMAYIRYSFLYFSKHLEGLIPVRAHWKNRKIMARRQQLKICGHILNCNKRAAMKTNKTKTFLTVVPILNTGTSRSLCLLILGVLLGVALLHAESTIDPAIRKERTNQYERLPRFSLNNFQSPYTEGSRWNSNPHGLISGDGLVVTTEKILYAKAFEISLDNDDDYTIAFFKKGKMLHQQLLTHHLLPATGGLYVHCSRIPEGTAEIGFDALLIVPSGGDGMYALGHIAFFSTAPKNCNDVQKESELAHKKFSDTNPASILPLLQKHLVPMNLTIEKDTIVPGNTSPGTLLRKITAQFFSVSVNNRTWMHRCVLLLPQPKVLKKDPERKKKVLVFGVPTREGYFDIHVKKYAEPIVAKTGFPVMIVANPGYYTDGTENETGLSHRIEDLARRTGAFYHNVNAYVGIVYVRAIDALEKILKIDNPQVIAAGHSKRACGAMLAAAFDSRIISVMMQSFEAVPAKTARGPNLMFFPVTYQNALPDVSVFYVGVTNEDGYKMFAINEWQKRLERPMTLEIIANYYHSNFHEIQCIDAAMWTSHVFDKRPIARIGELHADIKFQNKSEQKYAGTVFKTRVTGNTSVKIVKLWYAYSADPKWRDIMWYFMVMEHRGNGNYTGWVPGKRPDAAYVEVNDAARGVAGYVSSSYLKLTDMESKERTSTGSWPKQWKLYPK